MPDSEIEWLRENPFRWERGGILILIDVCECGEEPRVRLAAALDGPESAEKRHSPSIDYAIASVLRGCATAVHVCAAKATEAADFKLEGDLDEVWELIRELAEYQRNLASALHIRITPGAQISTLAN